MRLDLTKLSDKEITELRKAVIEEVSNRGYRLKSNARVYGNLLDAGFKDQLISEGLDDKYLEAASVVGSVEKAIYKLCDVSLGNYEIKEMRKRTLDTLDQEKWNYSKHLVCNGSTLYDECYSDFLDMAEEITNVCIRYFNKSKAYRNVKYKGYERGENDNAT